MIPWWGGPRRGRRGPLPPLTMRTPRCQELASDLPAPPRRSVGSARVFSGAQQAESRHLPACRPRDSPTVWGSRAWLQIGIPRTMCTGQQGHCIHGTGMQTISGEVGGNGLQSRTLLYTSVGSGQNIKPSLPVKIIIFVQVKLLSASRSHSLSLKGL